MINEHWDDYPFISTLDSYDQDNKFHNIEMIKDYNKLTYFPFPLNSLQRIHVTILSLKA